MNYIEVEGYYSTLNLVIESFEKMGLPKYHFARINKLSELIHHAYNGSVLNEFIRNEDEVISAEEFRRGMLLDSTGNLIMDHEGCCIPDLNFSVLEEAKKKSCFKACKSIILTKAPV